MGPEIELQARSDGFKGSGKNECLSVESKDESVAMSEAKDTLRSAAGGRVLVEAHCQDETESSCSSSFGGTASESEDAINTVSDEDELNLFGNNSLALDINEAGQLMRVRKRKLTNHWRTYIQPLKWRCKWTELQVKKLKAFALKYDRKLTNNNQNLMKRKKRRIGGEMNPTSYMSNHPLFSYFDKKMRIAPGASLEQGGRNQEKVSGSSESGVLEERLWVESGIGDNSLEELLKKIELLQAKVREQKSRLEQVKAEDTKYKTVLVVPSNTTSLTQSPTAPANNGTRTPIISSNIPSRLTSLYSKGGVVMPKSAVLSHGGVSMSGVLKGKDRLTRVGEEFVKAENDVLIYDERLKEGMQNYDLSIPMENSPATKEKLQNTSSKALIEPEPHIKLQRPLKMQHVSQPTPPKKRKISVRQKSSPSKLQRTS